MNDSNSYSLYWISCNKFTCGVEVDEETDLILTTAPILKKFKYQPFDNLKKWLNKTFKNVQIVEVDK